MSVDQRLTNAAQAHSADQAARDTMSHTGSDGSNAGTRISRQGYGWRAWAENVAMGYPDGASVTTAWMNSPGHRANILSASVTQIGVGLAYAADGSPYWTQVFAAPALTRCTRHGVRARRDTPSVGSGGCRACDPDGRHRPHSSSRPDDRPAPAIVGSWVGGTVHLWGWDGAHTALPNSLHRAFAAPRWGSTANPFLDRPPVVARRRRRRRRGDAPGVGAAAGRPCRPLAARAPGRRR